MTCTAHGVCSRQCVTDWLDSLELDPHTMATYYGQAEKWIYPKIGAKKLAEFKATDADWFLRDVAKVLSKASLVKIKRAPSSGRSAERRSTTSSPGMSPSWSTCRRASQGTRRAL